MSTPVVVGLDLSLTSTGICVADAGGVAVSKVTSSGKKDATLTERQARLRKLADSIWVAVCSAQPSLVVVEGPSFAQPSQGGQHDRAGLWWLVVDRFTFTGWPIVEVPPTCRAKYATGKGNAAKDAVLAAVVRRYTEVEVSGNDEADGLVLAAMGRRRLGAPIDDPMPQAHVAAMDAVHWGEVG
ncbi:hypothetical protein [Tenggerimyces flavus]|uniref:Holliday junction nuclease RuvC n=1 Tax=Tenggerimyces flavus TaxID=1708749 RepID=A0ABV7Y9P7_9ACTN|nr:hypothetical protein [Tenggerimyces flavus]MBM7788887.1 Holliday junction resolvasome RuvABC endonuclease subunit [Tenggerimyces flavus]